MSLAERKETPPNKRFYKKILSLDHIENRTKVIQLSYSIVFKTLGNYTNISDAV